MGTEESPRIPRGDVMDPFKPTPGERAEILRRAHSFIEKIESGEIVSFVAVYAHGDGSQIGSIAACHPAWARCGGRDFSDKDLFDDVMIAQLRARGFPGLIVHGGAKGADAMAAQVATMMSIPCVAVLPDWARGKIAGPMRNQTTPDLLRDSANEIELNGTPSQVGMLPEQLREVAAQMERMRSCFDTLQRSVEAEGYEVLINFEGTEVSVRRIRSALAV